MVTLLMAINGYFISRYFINGYWCLLVVIILVVIGGYWWILVVIVLVILVIILLMAITGYSFGG